MEKLNMLNKNNSQSQTNASLGNSSLGHLYVEGKGFNNICF